MTCPHCSNDDFRMMERINLNPVTILCKCCSKTFPHPYVIDETGPALTPEQEAYLLSHRKV